jgi:signal peptidase I
MSVRTRAKPKPEPKKAKSRSNSLVELVVIVAIAVGLAFLIQAFVVKPYKIPSGSMEPTLAVGQRVLVNRIGTHFGEPHLGEIAVFNPPEGAEHGICGPIAHTVTPGGAACSAPLLKKSGTTFIKRIVAGPGEWIYVKEGHAYTSKSEHGPYKREHDPYIRACGESSECNFPTPIMIPAGHWFMMGDNRGNSEDSRFWGPVPTSWIIGEAFATYWPPDKIGTL